MRRHLRVERQPVLGAADERFGQVDRVVNDVDPRQDVAAANPEAGDLGLIAGHRAVAADVVLFQVRRGDPQHVAFPRGGGEPAPRVVGFRGRRVAAVEIHRHVGGLVPLGLVGDDLARERIDFLRDAELRRAAVDVGPAVRPALVFRKAQDRGVPPFGAGQPVGVERQPDPVADPRVFGVVHRADHRPLAGEVDLRAPRCPRTRRAPAPRSPWPVRS